MMMDILFALQAGPEFPRMHLYVGAFSLLVLLSIGFFIFLRASRLPNTVKNTMRNIPSWLLSFAVIGFMLVFFRLSAVPYLSMRFLYVVLFACFLWYVIATFLRLQKQIPEKMAAVEKRKEKESRAKYQAPKKKKEKRKK